MEENKIIDLGIELPDKQIILVVDDEPNLQSIVFDCLSEDYRLISAMNGREGIQKAERNIPDLIILDVMMPDMGGYEALRVLRDNKTTKNIPIIMSSAVNFDPSTIDMLKNEPNVKGFLNKPFKPRDLRNMVKRFIRKLR